MSLSGIEPCSSFEDSTVNFEQTVNHKLFPYLAFLRTPLVGPRTFVRCFDNINQRGNLFFSDERTQKELGLNKQSIKACSQLAQALESKEKNEIIEGVYRDLRWEQQNQHHIVVFSDEAYPEQLRQLYDFPVVLYVKGNLELLKRKQLAMVGSRRPTKVGIMNAKAFSKSLVENDWVITSGLANGIDAFSHEGALSTNTESTIAVLAHGLDGIYPKRNQQLAARIINNGGALVSEFPTGVLPRAEFFPRRNRIISGLALGVLVVEAVCKSGSLITAYSALEQNREVFAIPGSIHNPLAKGCHELIKQGANLVQQLSDIQEHFHLEYMEDEKGKTQNKENKLDKNEQAIINVLESEEYTANEIAEFLQLPINLVSSSLTILEMKGLVCKGARGYIQVFTQV